MVTRTKVLTVVYLGRDQYLTSGPDIEAQPGIGIIVLGHNKEHSPLTIPKDPFKCIIINCTWFRRIAWMRMQPKAGELFRFSTEIDLVVKEVSYCRIVKPDTNRCHFLLDGDKLPYKEQVIGVSDSKSAYFVI